MPDPAEQLARLYQAGFGVETFERYPRAVGVVRNEVIALYEPTPDGLRMMGTPGWRVAEGIAVLTTVQGRPVFQFKSQIVEATAERLREVEEFKAEAERLLASQA